MYIHPYTECSLYSIHQGATGAVSESSTCGCFLLGPDVTTGPDRITSLGGGATGAIPGSRRSGSRPGSSVEVGPEQCPDLLTYITIKDPGGVPSVKTPGSSRIE